MPVICMLNVLFVLTYRGKVSELHIKKATEVHAGPYICEASNNLGKARIVGNLTVIHGKTER